MVVFIEYWRIPWGFGSKLLDGTKEFSMCIVDFQSTRIRYSEFSDLAENFYCIGPGSIQGWGMLSEKSQFPVQSGSPVGFARSLFLSLLKILFPSGAMSAGAQSRLNLIFWIEFAEFRMDSVKPLLLDLVFDVWDSAARFVGATLMHGRKDCGFSPRNRKKFAENNRLHYPLFQILWLQVESDIEWHGSDRVSLKKNMISAWRNSGIWSANQCFAHIKCVNTRHSMKIPG
jgi:hypothetical protein